jgi:hypothetical protein
LERFKFLLDTYAASPILNRSKSEAAARLDRSRKERMTMRPVDYLFEEIYRDYWGIPPRRDEHRRNRPAGLHLPGRKEPFRRRER